jgi:hypothetical protein
MPGDPHADRHGDRHDPRTRHRGEPGLQFEVVGRGLGRDDFADRLRAVGSFVEREQVRVTEDDTTRVPQCGAGGGGARPAPPRVKKSAPSTGGSLTSVTVMLTVAGEELEKLS